MNVLSLFDGMSCGQIALQRAGIHVDNYYASEIDQYAIQVTQKNFPNTIQLGTVTDLNVSEIPKIDLLIGGSPCTGFSFAGKKQGLEDPRSNLFFEFVRVLKECKPTYFLLENVPMKKEHQDTISKHLGLEPVLINSNLVSAQNRKRLYWTNIPDVTQPDDKGILLKDIITTGGTPYCCASSGRGNGKVERRVTSTLKAHTLTAGGYGSRSFSGSIDDGVTRKLSPVECEKLQTVPDNYTEGVSNTQRYRMLGNGWTVDVIAHIFSGSRLKIGAPKKTTI
jgi:site-specific DNA-cytosine methylase